MNFQILCLISLIVVALGSPYGLDWPDDDWEAFQLYQERFGLNFATNSDARFKVFADNRRTAMAVNAMEPEATFGITRFMHLTSEEFLATFTGLKPRAATLDELRSHTPLSKTRNTENKNLPYMWDYRSSLGLDYITPVKNQGQCGSCWAFAASASAETICRLNRKSSSDAGNDLDIYSLSPQWAVDCIPDLPDNSASNSGCEGSMPHAVYYWANKENIKQPSWLTYPYFAKEKQCQKYKAGKVGYSGYTLLNPDFNFSSSDLSSITTEDYVKALYENGPIAAAMDATGLQFYVSGVIMTRALCSWSINHAVTAIGFAPLGVSSDIAANAVGYDNHYLIIKNSWGETWGEKGYFRLYMGPKTKYPIQPDAKWGVCGILRYGTFPHIAK